MCLSFKGISGWAAITSRTLKEWDRFVGAIIFWVVIASLMSALPFIFLPELSLFSAKNESTAFDAQSFDIVMLVSVFSFVALLIFSILIATWMPAAIYNDKVSLRRVVARGKKTFWYVFSRLIILILFTLVVSAVALVVLTPVLQAVLPRVENPTLIVFIVNSGGTALVTSCLVPIFCVICVRAYNLGEARLNDTFGDSESLEAEGSGAA